MPEELASLQQLLEQVSGKRFLDTSPPGDRGLAEDIRFPFLALVCLLYTSPSPRD